MRKNARNSRITLTPRPDRSRARTQNASGASWRGPPKRVELRRMTAMGWSVHICAFLAHVTTFLFICCCAGVVKATFYVPLHRRPCRSIERPPACRATFSPLKPNSLRGRGRGPTDIFAPSCGHGGHIACQKGDSSPRAPTRTDCFRRIAAAIPFPAFSAEPG